MSVEVYRTKEKGINKCKHRMYFLALRTLSFFYLTSLAGAQVVVALVLHCLLLVLVPFLMLHQIKLQASLQWCAKSKLYLQWDAQSRNGCTCREENACHICSETFFCILLEFISVPTNFVSAGKTQYLIGCTCRYTKHFYGNSYLQGKAIFPNSFFDVILKINIWKIFWSETETLINEVKIC